MTEKLETAWKKLNALPLAEQDFFADFIIAELESEKRWDNLFAATTPMLDRMAADAIAEDSAGFTKPLNLERDF